MAQTDAKTRKKHEDNKYKFPTYVKKNSINPWKRDKHEDICSIMAVGNENYDTWYNGFSFPNGVPIKLLQKYKKLGMCCDDCCEIFRRQRPSGHAEDCKSRPGGCSICGVGPPTFLCYHPHEYGCPVVDFDRHCPL